MKPPDAIVTMALVVAVTLAAACPAQASTRSCAPAKIVAAGVYMDDALSCYADSATTAAAQLCLQKAARKLTDTFAALERAGGCQTTNDAVATMTRVDASIGELLRMLGNSGAGQCRRQVLAAMGKDAERQHHCYADAVARGNGSAVEAACQSKATVLFLADVTRTDSSTCATVDGPAIDTLIRAAARTSRGTLAQPITTCTPVEVTSLHGSSFVPNSRLARIENGQVACMHVDDMTIAACAFSTAPGSASGEWLESPQGTFALVGQAISLAGIPGGAYVVAAKVSDTTPASCVEGVGMDTSGLIEDGQELARTCVVEDLLAPWNNLMAWGWYPLVNYADREVCSSDRIHPDGAVLVRSYPASGSGPDDTFCYSGFGAALNDINGTERDFFGVYYYGSEFCHRLVNAGYEIPASKRPAVRTFPAPGGVNTQSPILWRPVSPTFLIANGDTPNTIQTFNQKAGFQELTGATPATGPLPDIGPVTDRATVGTVTFSLALGGNTLAIGASGSGAAPDWYPQMAGHEIALGYESLQVQTANPVYAIGFDVVEPNVTMPAYGGTPGDSTFEVVLYLGSTEVGRTSFNAADDVVAFVGVWSARAFDRITIVDTSGNDDDEYFGQFYTGNTPK